MTTGKAESVCAVKETIERDADGGLLVIANGEMGGESRTSRQTYVAKKKQ